MSYLSLSDYALIGNLASSALVSRLGSIDWCCLPFLDSPSHFAAILDESRGGKFQLMPIGDFRSEQKYLQRTQIVETYFETPHGRAVLTDWMPMDEGLRIEPLIFRKLEVIDGKVSWQLMCNPRFEYGTEIPIAEKRGSGITFRGPKPGELAHLNSNVPLEISFNGTAAGARFHLPTGELAQFSWSWGRRSSPDPVPRLDQTANFWRDWAHRCPPSGCLFAGPWHEIVTRSSLVLKLLITPFAGSISESVTTSLPGIPGTARTWDYRYSWLRDGALAIQALASLGFSNESNSFFQWLIDIVERDGAESLQTVYSLDGGKTVAERELPFLQGYQGAKPVRIGNNSSRRFQLDIYGHILLAAAEHYSTSGDLLDHLWPKLAEIADYVCQAWRRPDHGPWESRTKPEHFVMSKVYCWVALDRAAWLARMLGKPVSNRWINEKKILHRTICDQGFDPGRRSFVRSFGGRELDAATLAIPLLRFLPYDDPRVLGTLNAIQQELADGVLLYRHHADDGLPGPEGAHLVSSLLYVSCLALCGRVDEASDRMAELCAYATPLGLFGDQINPVTGETSGNFPSAAAHLAVINAALYIGMARGRTVPLHHVLGLPDIVPSAKTA